MKKLASLSLFAALVTSPGAQAQTFSVIHTFSGIEGDHPQGVTLRAGTLYGTAGNGYGGVVYQLTPEGSGWLFTSIFPFLYRRNGIGPTNLVFGPDGHLYGTAQAGGVNILGRCYYCGDGVVFELTPRSMICKTANCFWQENVFHTFTGAPGDGNEPVGDVAWDQQGNIYGTTVQGGTADLGTLFQLNLQTDSYSVIHHFLGYPDGDTPRNGVVVDTSGNLFGTTSGGGPLNSGSVFELTYVPEIGWTETFLHSFDGCDEFPYAGLTMDSSGNLYGATVVGCAGGGTIFELSPSGDTWTYKVLYSIPGPGQEYTGPYASLTMDAAGNLYGSTGGAGAYKQGNVFELSNTPNGWVYTSLHDFTGGSDGGNPFYQVAIDTDGTLYGTTNEGGGGNCGFGCGVVWMIKP